MTVADPAPDTVTSRSGADARSGVGRGRDERDEVDLPLLERTVLVEPGQQQQVVDEHAHAHGLLLDARHGRGSGLARR